MVTPSASVGIMKQAVSNGNVNSAPPLESYSAGGVKDYKDSWKLIQKKSFLFHRKGNLREDIHPCTTDNSEKLATAELSK